MVKTIVSGGQKSSLSFYGGSLCACVIIIASFIIQTRDSPPLNEYLSKNISSKKPYETFQEFYPYYLNEHKKEATRQFHYIGTTLSLVYFLTKPILSIPMLAGGLAAYSIIPFARHLSTGLVEVILFLTIYLTGGKLLTNSLIKTCIPLLIGYGFSWIGHFAFELNKPASFIYPTYSFFGDVRMMYDAMKGCNFSF
ncbi:unnamed protein product [Rotaria magnacalcarata]|uniref:Uncharacterized protein n=1 Tax=Rotaria magnacalcarata TaxID=392030 RepID=A0A818XAT7_9BILA|nr:unnamed protein product [Rotaria magnacalcarata]CAF2210729.1 unnamed protein product [Rotaria magnacalcarata]CAF3737811.1 unnamed protein product [Rotaria magnacalcarata]CAF4025457.1 unnamed protein product [Rotaria magnacalcarata]